MAKLGSYKEALAKEKSAEKKWRGMAIGLPCYGGEFSMETRSSISALRNVLSWQHAPSEEYALAMCSIVDARNCMLTWWYDATDYDHLLMVDNDMQFAADLVFKMIQHDKPITGVIYSKRQVPDNREPWSIIVGTPEAGEQEIINGFQKWKYVGAGVLLIKRHVVTDMLKKIPNLSDNIDPGSHKRTGVTRIIRAFDEIRLDNGVKLSEDNSFCERWRQCGGEIWAGVDYPIGHIGKFNYCINAAELLGLKKQEAEAA